ncbi:MAG: DUF2188 domain-containing protein [bacterium]
MGKNVHIVPNGKKWAVKTENSKRSYRVTETQKESIQIGKQLAKRNKSEMIVQGKNGQIREKNSYGNDDFPPKG